jgi:thioredoxin 1
MKGRKQMSAIRITKNNFESEIKNYNGKILLDFWASWCGPCRMVSPLIDEIANENTHIKVGKINVDEEPELASAFSVMSIPTLAVIDQGRLIRQQAGARPKEAILAMLD